MKRGHVVKTKLTPEEKVKVAYAYLILGIDQHALVAMFSVNQGRINDAITAVRKAVEWPHNGDEEEEEKQI